MQLKKKPLAGLLQFLADMFAKQLKPGWQQRLVRGIGSMEDEYDSLQAIGLIAQLVPTFTDVTMGSEEIVCKTTQFLVRIKPEALGNLTVQFNSIVTAKKCKPDPEWSVVLIFSVDGHVKLESYRIKPGVLGEKFRASTQTIYGALGKVSPESFERTESYGRFRSLHYVQPPIRKTKSDIDPGVLQTLAGLALE